ncbi:hypothetical protein IAT38_001889 [Cryptococcus sp. DSM 104549]
MYNGTGNSTGGNADAGPSNLGSSSSDPKRPRPPSPEPPRMQLACFPCRTKRIRCIGGKPVCEGCTRAGLGCEWPAARARKRTKKEMEEARRLEGVGEGVGMGAGGPARGQGGVEGEGSTLREDREGGSSSASAQPPLRNTQPTTQDLPPPETHATLWALDPSVSASSAEYTWPPDLTAGTGMRPLNDLSSADAGSGPGTGAGAGAAGAAGVGQAGVGAGQAQGRVDMPRSASSAGHSSVMAQQQQQAIAPAPAVAHSGSTHGPSGDVGSTSVHPVEPTDPRAGVGGASTGASGMGFLNVQPDWSPDTESRLASALENQTAFINGNPDGDDDLELFYYRISGSTAIAPGVNRIALKLQRRNDASPLAAAPQPSDDEPPPGSTGPTPSLFDDTGMPHPHVWRPLFALFFKHMSQHFPSCSHQRMMERFETGTMSQFLACCICSLGARFSPDAGDPAQAAAPFIAKAQELVTPLLHLPTYDVLTGLLYLAWANYGQNSESGLWQYSGMSIRMAIDLGAHEISEIHESEAHVVRNRLLFWSLFVTDRIVAFATGRPASFPEDVIEIPLTSDEDYFPDPARNLPDSPFEPVEPVPYVHLVKLMIICGRISNVLNGRRGRALTLASAPEPLTERLADLQLRLVTFYSSLPDSLKWSADTFKHQHGRGHGGTFLALHLWANAVLALVYHPELLKSPSGVETPLNRSMPRNVQLALAASRQICECMVFADLVDSSSYTSAPYLSQPLFVAGMAFIHEMRSLQASANDAAQPSPTDILMFSMAKQNFSAILNAVHKIEEYWAGAHYVATLLEKRSGFPRPTKKSSKRTFISLPDKGLLKRFSADPQHPQNVGPPTDTSLRESIARNQRASTFNSLSGLTPLWLSDLMSGYTVENMSFAPVDTLDLERLFPTGLNGGTSTTGAQTQANAGQG